MTSTAAQSPKNVTPALPAVRFGLAELDDPAVLARTSVLAAAAFRDNGVLLIENAFSTAFIDKLHAAYTDEYRAYFLDLDYPDALNVGDKRTMITVAFAPPFNDPDLYASPLVLPIIRRLLGERCILGSFGSVTSLPGSDLQHMHADHPRLFDDDPVDAAMPPFAITMIVPLVDLNETNGTTRVYPGSHKAPIPTAKSMAHCDPVASRGACLLMDYRLFHGGTPNRSAAVRPILYNVYYRPWFRDFVNFGKQPPLEIDAETYGEIPDSYRSLFQWALRG